MPRKVKNAEKSMKNISNIEAKTTSMLYGVSQEFIEKNSNEINKIRDTIQRISTRNNIITGENPIEFLTKMAYNDSSSINSKRTPKDNKGKIDINKLINGMTLGQINEIYAAEQSRISNYEDYRAIVRYIPQVAQGVSIWKDNIISPDDFTKDIFDIIYDDGNNSELKARVEKNIYNIIHKKYKIEDKLDEWIIDTLVLGDQFIAVLKLEDEFSKLFQESNFIKNENGKYVILDESTILNEEGIILSENAINSLSDLYIEKMTSTDKEFKKDNFNKEDYANGIRKEISDILNNNIKFSSNPCSLLEGDLSIIEQFGREASKDKFHNVDPKSILNSGDSGISSKGNKKNSKSFINGSYIKNLEPERVIKIKVGEVVYGYFYVEVRGENDIVHPRNVYSALTLRQTVDLSSSNTSQIDDPKIRLVCDLFAKNIAKKIDKEFIADNKEFKTIIYELLQKEYIYNNNIQITYFEPSTIKHLMVKEGPDGYGISILKDIAFTAKLYLSVLITTLLTKISRSQEHRAYYIETGLSEDVEGIVNSFIRDMETKDVKISDTQSIDSIFNTIGSNASFYIPMVNGEKAIDIDTIQGLNVDMNDDFLDFLRKAMMSGIGVPPSMLNYADELEFARSVSMQNGMFLRGVISKQKKLTPPFSSMYQDLYRNEFGENITLIASYEENKKKDKAYKSFLTNKDESEIMDDIDDEKVKKENAEMEENQTVDISLIKVQFPSPSSLNMTNLNEQIGNAQNIVQNIVESTFSQNNTDEIHKHRFTMEMNKIYMPNIDWDKVEEIYNSTKIDATSEKLEASLSAKEEDTETPY